jgi:hypothetical protein
MLSAIPSVAAIAIEPRFVNVNILNSILESYLDLRELQALARAWCKDVGEQSK